jgi:YYY domain-containing protein
MIASAIALSYPLVLNRRSAPAEAGQWARTVGPPVASTLEPVSVASFVLLLVLAASLLTLAPEFVYLKDVFQGRMNTVFKFYYLAWVLLAVSSGYALHGLLRRAGWVRWVGGLGGALLIAAGLFYPVLAVATRTAGRGGSATLDGMAYMENSQPADYAAIRWLQENVEGTPLILEAVGGQYSWGARISAHTGLPTVLGWAGHEQQWRGDTHEPGLREPDVRTMYTSRVWPEVQALLEKYQVEYVVVGPLEISTYGQVAAAKFERVLDAVFQGDGVVIYRWHRLIQP